MSEGRRWHRFETKILQEIFDLVSIVNPDVQETGKKMDPEDPLGEIYLINWAIEDPEKEENALKAWEEYLSNRKEDGKNETDNG